MRTRGIGGTEMVVGAIGLGCMSMSYLYDESTRDDAVSREVLRAAPGLGVTLIDTAPIYGAGANESLVGEALQGLREEVTLATKCGLYRAPDGERRIDGDPAMVRALCEESLRRLRTDVIDVYQLHRVDPTVPLADTWGAMAELKAAGKVRALGISEASLEQIELVHAIEPVDVVQSELSLWTRHWVDDVLPWTVANGAAFLAYAPVGRGFLTGSMGPDRVFEAGDFRGGNPRFQPEALAANQSLLDLIRPVADAHGATLAQVALAWLVQVAPSVIPIPGTRNPAHLREDAAAGDLVLTDDEMAVLTALPAPFGTRY